jgi:tetratricopeptide (TPR) repeat protein
MSLLEQAESTYIKASQVCRCADDNPDNASNFAGVSVQINASSHLPHFFLGVVHTKQGRFDAAITAYEHALVLDPRFFPSLHNLGSVHFILGNNDQALFYFKAALDLLKDDPNFQWDGEEKEIKATILVIVEFVGLH